MPMARPKSVDQPVVTTPVPTGEMARDFPAQRPLIRPTLPARSAAGRSANPYGHGSSLTARAVSGGVSSQDSSHAEVFYFQKQIQSQTRMVVVLENGMELEGIVEWYDRYAIKLRNVGSADALNDGHTVGRNRVLIYKDGIRYIYKAGENGQQTMT